MRYRIKAEYSYGETRYQLQYKDGLWTMWQWEDYGHAFSTFEGAVSFAAAGIIRWESA